MNRVGDYCLVLGILLTIAIFYDLQEPAMSGCLNGDLIFIFTIFLIIGASAKSAQLGLHVWLPSAMEGPTPVSALIHAATIRVTVGLEPTLEFTTGLQPAT